MTIQRKRGDTLVFRLDAKLKKFITEKAAHHGWSKSLTVYRLLKDRMISEMSVEDKRK
jgi:hypothetical protein